MNIYHHPGLAGEGNRYVADLENGTVHGTIQKVTPDGQVAALTGKAGTNGSTVDLLSRELRRGFNPLSRQAMRTRYLLVAVITVCCLLTVICPSLGQSWTRSSAPTTRWYSVASSADGTKLVAVGNPSIYTSTNSGATWRLACAPTNLWFSVASSADGTKLVAAAQSRPGWDQFGFGDVYTSTDSGATWTLTSAPSNIWQSVASSADGTKLVAVGATAGGGGVHFSTNSGLTWTPAYAPLRAWESVASSADGTKLVAVAAFSPIYTSRDSAATWSSNSSPSLYWTSVASSADGTKLVAAVGGVGDITGPIFRSSNSGETWTQTSAPIDGWSSLASSADGTQLVAAVGRGHLSGYVYFSTDAGATWTKSSAHFDTWNSVASSADGTKRVAVILDGGIYTSEPDQTLSTLPSPNGQLVVTWPSSAPGFRLQQNSDLTTTNWTDVPSAPTVTNLQNQLIMVTVPTGNNFYRLKRL